MNCIDVEQLIEAYLDGELSGALRVEFDAHRLNCSVCQRKVALLETCGDVLAGDQDLAELSGDFTDRVMHAVALRPRVSRLPRRLTLAAAVGLQAAAVLAFIWLVGPFRQAAPPVAGDGGGAVVHGETTENGPPLDLSGPVWDRVDAFAAARSNLLSDFVAVANLVRSLEVPADVVDIPAGNPFYLLQRLLVPESPDDGPAGTGGVYSL